MEARTEHPQNEADFMSQSNIWNPCSHVYTVAMQITKAASWMNAGGSDNNWVFSDYGSHYRSSRREGWATPFHVDAAAGKRFHPI